MAPALSAVMAPAIPVERRKGCGKTTSAASAAATVSALKSTLRPALRIVASCALRNGTPSALSSR